METVTPAVPTVESDRPLTEMTYLEQYAPAWVAEVLDLCDRLA